ncbi:adenylate/guanylate cyclase domain-containing protein [Methyloglobulus sp.]|uniref:CHASE2 domain-containing protein n=1 Tax=Methyloglobulus sp. TaxID=2518622 RepID=UPI0032B74FAE
MLTHFLRPLTIAVCIFLLGGIIDYGTDLELKLGLTTLFQVRGARMPPDEIVIVAMDEKSDVGQSGGDFTQWRGKHAELIEKLQHYGVALVVFDLYFNDPQPSNDATLTKAMQNAGNVLATDCVQTAVNSWTECGNKPGPTDQSAKALSDKAMVVKVNPPTAELAQAMLDHSPFFLSNDPGNPTLRQGWNFIDDHLDHPTLPVLIWFYFLEHKGDLQKVDQPFSTWLSEQRRTCRGPLFKLPQKLSDNANLNNRIEEVICQNQNQYLDFYGPPESFRTASYSDVLAGKVNNLKNKVVFVGQTSRRQSDSFLTPFTDTSSGRMVGVEVMATQFANLLEGRNIAPPIPLGLSMALFGLLASVLLTQFSGLPGIGISIFVSVAYFGFAVWWFNLNGSWLPIAVPLLLQLPLAWFLSLYWSRLDQLKEAKRLKAKIEQITAENNRLINQFVDSLQQANTLTLSMSGEGLSEKSFGVCLVSDIEGFTQLAEKMPPNILFDRLRDYFKVLGTVVSTHGGKIANITGDGMVAIWVDPTDSNHQHSACLATIQMSQAVDRLNSSAEKDYFLTRFGLHEGEFALGKRTGDKLDDNPIGDAINTASRLEGANKLLGTRILASSSITTKVSNVLVRPVGAFLLVGKNQPIELIEIVGIRSEADNANLALSKHFARGLKAFRKGRWQHAQAIFNKLIDTYGYDGPTNYYLNKLGNQEKPPPEWNGYTKLESK